jgi:hypothetical protein
MLSISGKSNWGDLDAIKAELLSEAPIALSKKYRRMIYNYETQSPEKRRQTAKTPGFKEARAKFAKKPAIQKDRWQLKDALAYIKSEKRNPHYSKTLYKYNSEIYLKGLQEINKIRNSSVTDEKKHAKLTEVLKRIRNYHVFKVGSLDVKEYVQAWDMAYGSIGKGKYDHKKFLKGTKRMLEGIKHFDQSFVKKMRARYLKK